MIMMPGRFFRVIFKLVLEADWRRWMRCLLVA